MAELAYCFGVEKAALTGLMDRAERRGLARRSPVPGDRRALQVTMTDAGQRTAAAFHAELGARLNGLISSLAPQDRELSAARWRRLSSAARHAAWPVSKSALRAL